jgi:hypothetical protein
MPFIGNQPTSVPLTSSDITDGIISLPKLTDGTDGNLISYDASGNPVAVATGTDGQVLTSTGAGSPPAFETLPGGGKVLQVLSTTKTDLFSTSSASYVDITGLSVSITPSSASNKILTMVTLNCGNSTATVFEPIRLLRDSTAICIGDAAGSRTRASSGSGRINDVSDVYNLNINFLDSPSTTSATTYKVQIFANAATTYVNSNGLNADNAETGRYASTITVMEVSA